MTLARYGNWLSLCVVIGLVGCNRHHNEFINLTELSTPVSINAVKGSKDGVSLTWESVTEAKSYAIYRCEVPEGITDDLVGSTSIDQCNTPIAVTTELNFTDVPPHTAPQAYVYYLKACGDLDGSFCGNVIAAIPASQSVTAALQQMITNIGDDGRQVISGLEATLHAFASETQGLVTWDWIQESGPKVVLQDANTSELKFTAPIVTENTLLSFELRTSDDNGAGRPSKVAVTVTPANNVSVKVGASSRLTQSQHLVSLHAMGSNPNLHFEWRQLSQDDSAVVTLIDANTANPTFITPNLPQGGILHFEVTATDPTTGRNASARTAVEVQYAVPTLTPILEPSQVPELVPTPVPMAQPLLMPLQIAQPLQVPQLLLLTPMQNPVLVPPKVPPQALVLLAPPVAIATGGTTIQLAMSASGGHEPYEWKWEQTSGPSATILDHS
ncbi:MAG: PKD domain-containing protein, partial [Shewanella sp.]